MAFNAVKEMYKEGKNPVASLDELLEDERQGSELLGNTMFWKHYDKFIVKNIFKNVNIEYRQLKFMFFEMLFFFFFLLCMTGYVAAMQAGSGIYEVQQQQQQYWGDCMSNGHCKLHDVNTRSEFWQWMRNDFPNKVWTTNQEYSSLDNAQWPMSMTLFELHDQSVPWTPRFVTDTETAILLGSIRIRQVRVQRNADCQKQPYFKNDSPNCYAPYDDDVVSTKTHAKQWTPKDVAHAYVHHGSNVTHMQPIVGAYASYPGSGFYLDINVNKSKALGQMTNLMEWDWIDDATRMVVMEINILNPNMNVIINNEILFEFGVEGAVEARHRVNAFSVKFLSMSLLQTDAASDFIWLVMFVASGIVFTGLTGFHLYKTGFRQFIQYIWNIIDFMTVLFFWIVLGLRLAVFTAVAAEPALGSELVAHTDIFMPYNVAVSNLVAATDVSALLIMMVWLKVLQYIGLVGLMRNHVLVIEMCIIQVCRFGTFLVSIFFGFAVALNVGFGDRIEMYSTLGGSFVSLFFWLTGGTSLDPLFQHGNVLGPGLYFMYLFLIYFLLANLFMAIVLDVYTFTRFHGKLSPNHKRDHNPMSVFLYTYVNKLKGVALVGLENEENVGGPDEQYIDKDLLPGVLVQAIEKKLMEMEEFLEGEDVPEAIRGKDYQGSVASRSVGNSTTGPKILRKPKQQEVSRVQLQRMLDEDPVLCNLVGTDQALKLIRAFKVAKPENAYVTITKLQQSVFATMDQIEKAGFNLPLSHKESLTQVATGLHEAVNDIQNQWRRELNTVLEISHATSENLTVLTAGLERLQLNLVHIQQNLVAERGGE